MIDYDMVRSVVVPMPLDVHSYVIKIDGFYTIILNANLSDYKIREAYKHEIRHIDDGDLESECPVGMLEIHQHRRDKR